MQSPPSWGKCFSNTSGTIGLTGGIWTARTGTCTVCTGTCEGDDWEGESGFEGGEAIWEPAFEGERHVKEDSNDSSRAIAAA